MDTENISFEQALAELQKQIDLLEKGNLPLDEALKIYSRAMEISRICNKKLDMAQAEVKKIVADEDGDGYKLENFEA